MATKKLSNVKRGYALAAEALRYLADKLSSIVNDEQLKVKSDLLKEGMDESVEEIRRKANRMDELYLKSSGPTTPGRERFGGLSVEEWDEAQSMYRLICYALKVYGDDLSQTKDSIITKVRTRKTDDEDLKRFLKFDEVDRQLEIIDEAIALDFCKE